MAADDRTVMVGGYPSAWGGYHAALDAARAARGRFFRHRFSLAGRYLKDRICPRVEKWHIHLCR
ncbi:MAG: hypothetical protein PVJ66_10085 [Gammaproteobacteria bacterium]